MSGVEQLGRGTWTAPVADTAGALARLRAENEALRAAQAHWGRLARLLGEPVDLEAILPAVVAVATEALGGDSGAIFLYADDQSRVVASELYCYPEGAARAAALALPWSAVPAERDMLADLAPVLVGAGQGGGAAPVRLPLAAARTTIVAPLLRDSHPLGCLYVHRHGVGAPFAAHDLALAGEVAAQTAAVVERARLFTEERRRRAEAEALAALARAASSLALPEVLDAALAMAARIIPCDLAFITLADQERAALRVAAARGLDADRSTGRTIPMAQGYNGWVYRERQPLLVVDADRDPRRLTIPGLTDPITNVLCVPLVARDRAIGTLYLGRSAVGSFTDGDLRLLVALAGQVALAVDNAQLFAAERRRRAEAEALVTVANSLSVGLSLEEILRAVTEQTRAALGVAHCSVWLADPEAGTIAARAWAGVRPANEARFRSLAFRLGELDAVDRALVEGRPTVIDDAAAEGGLPSELIEHFGIGAFLVVPIFGRSGAIGALYIDRGRPHHWTPEELRLAEALAGQAGAALADARLYAAEQQRAEREAALRQIARELGAELDLERVVTAVHRHLERLTGLDNRWIALWDEPSGTADVRLWVEAGRRVHEWEGQGPLRGGLLPALLDGRATILTDDYAAECARRGLPPVGHAADQPGRAWLGLPLLAGGRAIGALAVWRWDGPIPAEAVSTLETLAGHIATALENARLFEETERQRREEAVFNAIARDLAASLDSRTVLQRIADHARALFAADAADIRLFDPQGGVLRSAAGSGAAPTPIIPQAIRPGEGATGHTWATGQALAVEDYLADGRFVHVPAFDRAVREVGNVALLTAPIALGAERLGVLVVRYHRTRRFTAHDEVLLARLATQAALAVENARLYEAARRRADRLQLLNEVGHALSAELELDRFLDTAWRQLTRAVGVEDCWLALLDPLGGELDYCLYVSGGERRPEWERTWPNSGLGQALLTERRTIRVPDYVAECRRRGLTPSGPAVDRPGMAWLGVPLVTGGRVVGAMAVWRWDAPFGEEDAATLETLMGQVAIALENARLYQEARQLASTDPVTGLANHRHLHERLDEELARAARHRHAVAVVMLDLDNFKRFNDVYGHPAGDRVLRFVAQALRAETRASDVVGRYGGDEFMLVLPKTTVEGARALIERVRARLATIHQVLDYQAAVVPTMSAGVALYPADATERPDLIALADAALYASKRGG